MLTCSKEYRDIPFAHRQHTHEGHCAWLHGHNWTFKFTFGCHAIDENGFVIDFGKLKWLKEWLNEQFDHALVLNRDDPHLDYLKKYLCEDPDARRFAPLPPSCNGMFAKILVVPSASSEGLAMWLFHEVNQRVLAESDNRVFVWSVEVIEDVKNAAQYAPGAV